MIALTHVSREAYEGLLEDGKQPLGVLQEMYGAGFFMRLQGVLCAMAVRQCAKDAEEMGCYSCDIPPVLFDLVKRYDYGSIFEDNGLGAYKPGDALLDMMLYSMCQAETQDWRELDWGYEE